MPRGGAPGLVNADGRIADLSGVIPDLASVGSRRIRSRMRAGRSPNYPSRRPARGSGLRRSVGKFIAIGLNYADHAAETGARFPASRSCS